MCNTIHGLQKLNSSGSFNNKSCIYDTLDSIKQYFKMYIKTSCYTKSYIHAHIFTHI